MPALAVIGWLIGLPVLVALVLIILAIRAIW